METFQNDKVSLEQILNRIPIELIPKKITVENVLSALTQLKTERNNAIDGIREHNVECNEDCNKDCQPKLCGNVLTGKKMRYAST